MATWLLKTEPSEYAFTDLERDKRTAWDGVTNAAAQKHMRAMRRGDEAFIYHTGDEKRITGLARVTKGPYPDPAKPGTTAAGETKFVRVDIAPVRSAKQTGATLAAIKDDERFAGLNFGELNRDSELWHEEKRTQVATRGYHVGCIPASWFRSLCDRRAGIGELGDRFKFQIDVRVPSADRNEFEYELIVYKDEFHNLSRPSSEADAMASARDWIRFWVLGDRDRVSTKYLDRWDVRRRQMEWMRKNYPLIVERN